ncbi:MAG: homocysteine S-methyltransferase family protein, partial [Deltaproteobacteria bacterium]
MSFESAVSAFKDQARGLIEGGVDLIVIETMIDIQEARAALIAVKEIKDIFTIVTMTYEQDGRTLNGTDPVSALITLQSLGADAVGCNCSLGPSGMVELITKMKPYATVPLVAKPNAGLPKIINGETVFEMSAKQFGDVSKALVKAGANIIGGCCGTAPEHIRKLVGSVGKITTVPPQKKSISALSSPCEHLIIDETQPLIIIGERLNPTGKKALQEDMRSGKMASVRDIAIQQEQQGAQLLDVNVGVPNIDENQAMRSIISVLSLCAHKPLVIDSSNAKAIETALRLYPGRALLNSISGEKAKLKALLPLAKKYGAMFIMLPLTDKCLPETAVERIKIIKDIFVQAKKYGFTKDDIIVDGITMSIATNSLAGIETIKTIKWCADKLKIKTVLGLSNISFGMPQRAWINASFLAMAQSAGLTMAIANPASEELINIKLASDLLLQKDNNATAFVKRFATTSEHKMESSSIALLAPQEKLRKAILDGRREDIILIIQEALQA